MRHGKPGVSTPAHSGIPFLRYGLLEIMVRADVFVELYSHISTIILFVPRETFDIPALSVHSGILYRFLRIQGSR